MTGTGRVSARRNPSPWAGRAFYAVVVVLLAVSLTLLFRLLTSFEAGLDGRVEQLQRVFSDRDLLRTPSQSQIRFSAIEELAAKYRDDATFHSLTVTKLFDSGRGVEERIVYPYYAPALFDRGGQTRDGDQPVVVNVAGFDHPLPWDLPGDARKLPLRVGEQLLGNLYVRVDEGALNVVRSVIASLTALLIGALGEFALQFRRQEKVISRTTVELEEKRRELVRIERLALAGQLSANILHDLKKPVLNIKSEAEELAAGDGERAAGDGERVNALAEESPSRIRQQVDLFFGILRESSLERFVRAESEGEYVDVNELLDRSLALVRYERNEVAVERRYDPALPSILAEPVRLVQVFSNLILNAYQALEEKGRLTLTTRAEGRMAVVEIEDDGPGIPPKALQHIFLPFFTTKPEGTGTGLGLYITQDIVLDLGGTIRVENVATGGTRFTIEIPVPEELERCLNCPLVHGLGWTGWTPWTVWTAPRLVFTIGLRVQRRRLAWFRRLPQRPSGRR